MRLRRLRVGHMRLRRLRIPARAQQICDRLSAPEIDALLRKWLARLPHPFTVDARPAGYRYDVGILQAEFALTQVLDRSLTGRVFFEEVIRENLDIGRPSQVPLIFDRRLTKRTPGRSDLRMAWAWLLCIQPDSLTQGKMIEPTLGSCWGRASASGTKTSGGRTNKS